MLHPQRPSGVAHSHPSFFLFFSFFKKKNKFIYLFLIIFFYSNEHVSPSYWFDVTLTWHLTESIKNFNEI
jgi:hypothetical protein